MKSIDSLHAAGSDAATLLRLIREQAAAEIAEMQERTRERVTRLRASADTGAEAIRAGARSAGELRGRLRAAKLLAAAETQSHLELLVAREALIEKVIALARTRLTRFSTFPQATDRLAALVREGLEALPAGPVCVRMPHDCALLLDDAIRHSLTSDRDAVTFTADDEAMGGVILEVDDGRVRFDNSFDGRVRRRMYRLRRLAADMLLGEEPSSPRGL